MFALFLLFKFTCSSFQNFFSTFILFALLNDTYCMVLMFFYITYLLFCVLLREEYTWRRQIKDKYCSDHLLLSSSSLGRSRRVFDNVSDSRHIQGHQTRHYSSSCSDREIRNLANKVLVLESSFSSPSQLINPGVCHDSWISWCSTNNTMI